MISSFEAPAAQVDQNDQACELLAPEVEEVQPGPQRFVLRNNSPGDEDGDRSSFNTLDGREYDFDEEEVSMPRWPDSPGK